MKYQPLIVDFPGDYDDDYWYDSDNNENLGRPTCEACRYGADVQ